VRPSRSIAVIALVAMVLLRGVGFAAEAWTANAVECCCGRHAVDHDCGCPICPSHHHGARHDDGKSHLRSCAHHVDLAVSTTTPPAMVAPPAIDRPAPRAFAPLPQPLPSFESRVVHPETPPS
jgi:hypothetical protein